MKCPAAKNAATGLDPYANGAALKRRGTDCGTSLSAKWAGREACDGSHHRSLADSEWKNTLGAVASDRHARSPFSFSRPMADLPGAARFLLCRARPTAAAIVNLPDDRRSFFSEAAPAPIVESNNLTHRNPASAVRSNSVSDNSECGPEALSDDAKNSWERSNEQR